MRNGLISVDAYKKSRAFYIYEQTPILYQSFFPRAETREWKRFNGKGSMLCKSARGNAGVPQWKAGLIVRLL